MNSRDHGEYLTNLEGGAEEFVGQELDEIVLRAPQLGEGAATLRELAGNLRAEADRYDRLAADGWELTAPFADGVGRCRQDAEPAPPRRESPPTSQPPTSLSQLLDGAGSLSEAAERLRAAASRFVTAHDEGRRLAHPVEHGRVHVR